MDSFRQRATAVAIVLATLASIRTPAAAVTYVSRVADANRMGVTVTNYGFLGNNFISRAPSMEYPLGTGHEHLPNGGLWIGAHAAGESGPFTGVTTGCVDIGTGTAPSTATEFTPAGDAFTIRSTLLASPHYSPLAVSEMDVVGVFDDLSPAWASGNPERHSPLGVTVRQESYAWSQAPYADILFLHYLVTNTGPPLADVWVGLYTQLASGPKNAYTTWPPSSTGSWLGSWYSKKWLEYDAPLRMIREHRCSGYPIPDGCQLEVTPYWAGVELLTPPDPSLSQHVTLAAWRWSPGSMYRNEDAERYAIMSAGSIQSLTGDSLMPLTGDPVELLALGPFPTLASGDSLAVDFALVGGAEIADIQAHAAAAQAAYDLGYRDLPTPVRAALVRARCVEGRNELVWVGPARSGGARVERCAPGGGWAAIATIQADGSGYYRFDDAGLARGRYGYRLVTEAGPSEEVWLVVPGAPSFALEGPSANPVRGSELGVDFALADGTPARLDLLDVAGRVVASRDVGMLGAGSHRITLRLPPAAPAGVYFLRLHQGARDATARFVTIH